MRGGDDAGAAELHAGPLSRQTLAIQRFCIVPHPITRSLKRTEESGGMDSMLISGIPPTSLLVRGGLGFYNPSIASMDAVVSFTHHPSTEAPERMAVGFASKSMDIDPHFCNSQEH